MNDNSIDDEFELTEDNKEETSLKKAVNSFLAWINAHKVQIIFAGLSLFGIIMALRKMNNAKDAQRLIREVKHNISSKDVKLDTPLEDTTIQVEPELESIIPKRVMSPHKVNGHPRRLPSGYKASDIKLLRAAELGVYLEDGQTYVESYNTGVA